MQQLLSSHPLSVFAAKAFTRNTILVAIKLRIPRPVRPDCFVAGVEGLAGLGIGNRRNQHSCSQKDREAHQLGRRFSQYLVTALGACSAPTRFSASLSRLRSRCAAASAAGSSAQRDWMKRKQFGALIAMDFLFSRTYKSEGDISQPSLFSGEASA